MNKNTSELIRLLHYFPELVDEALYQYAYPVWDEEAAEWVYDNEYRLFDFGEFGKNQAVAFYSSVEFNVIAEFFNRKFERES